MAETYRCRRENSRPEPAFRYFSNARAFASDLNALRFRCATGGIWWCICMCLDCSFRREVLRDPGVVLSCISLAYKNINVEQFSITLACQAVVLERNGEHIKHEPTCVSFRRGSLRFALRFKRSLGLTGLEPVTLRLSSACSNQLSYRPASRK
jgi:hypothetical protein